MMSSDRKRQHSPDAERPLKCKIKYDPDDFPDLFPNTQVQAGSESQSEPDEQSIRRLINHFTPPSSVQRDKKVTSKWKIDGLVTPLESYQLYGSASMRYREIHDGRVKGGILADEMGLGKTVEMLANVVNSWNEGYQECRTTLVVTTPSTVKQWEEEIKKHVNAVDLEKYGGMLTYPLPKGRTTKAEIKKLKKKAIVVTSYATVLRSFSRYHNPADSDDGSSDDSDAKDSNSISFGPLHRVHFRRIVLDEAQQIRNWTTLTTKACFELKADRRWVVTGTPIINSIEDIRPYFRFLGLTEGLYQHLISKNAADKDRNREGLRNFWDSLVIRRTQKDVSLPIPDSMKTDERCKFSNVEDELYTVAEERFQEEYARSIENNNTDTKCPSAPVMLLRLRQLTSHPLLIHDCLVDLFRPSDWERIANVCERNPHSEYCPIIRKMLEEEPDQLDIIDDIPGIPRSKTAIKQSIRSQQVLKWLDKNGRMIHSTKTRAFERHIKQCLKEDPSMKIIVFTQFLSMMEILSQICKDNGWECIKYYGEMSVNQRDQAIKFFKFDKKRSILLTSLKTGGAGLNLTMASRTILIEPWWNSSVEDQAFGRVRRYGQEKETEQMRLIIEGTIDERMLRIQRAKDKEIKDILDGGASSQEFHTVEELKILFGMEEANDDENQDGESIWVTDRVVTGRKSSKSHKGEGN